MKYLMLTFDTEEFDLPFEFGLDQSNTEKFSLAKESTQHVLKILDKHNVTATFFVTANFANKFPKFTKQISLKHEIAIHGYMHSDDYRKMPLDSSLKLIKKAREEVSKIIGKDIVGFRAPRFQTPGKKVIYKSGYRYDSSLHPTYVPGRYNNFFKQRKIFKSNGLFEVPISVAPITRLPFSWIWFRNLPLFYTKLNSLLCLLFDKYLHLYFHPWEFVSLSHYNKKLPTSIIRNTGKIMTQKLEKYIVWAKNRGCKSITIKDFLKLE